MWIAATLSCSSRVSGLGKVKHLPDLVSNVTPENLVSYLFTLPEMTRSRILASWIRLRSSKMVYSPLEPLSMDFMISEAEGIGWRGEIGNALRIGGGSANL